MERYISFFPDFTFTFSEGRMIVITHDYKFSLEIKSHGVYELACHTLPVTLRSRIKFWLSCFLAESP